MTFSTSGVVETSYASGQPRPDAASAAPAGLAGGDAVAPLGNNADFASIPLSGPPDVHSFLPPPATVKAWHLRSVGREILKANGVQKRLRWCGSRIERGNRGVGLYARPDRVYGRVTGVCVCGQSICCPVCAPRIAAFRSAEVADGYERAKARGYEARLATYTFPHQVGNNLGSEIDIFADAWRKFGSGCMAAKRRQHSLGNIVGREVTFGKNGWHYHYHVLRFDLVGTYQEQLHRAGWLAALETIGRRTAGADLHAFHVGEIGDRARAAYCAKLATAVEAQARAIGSEIASAATKGRNLSTLLLSAAQGDIEAGGIWLAGVSEIVRRKVSSVRWSRGLRAELGLQAEKDDEQVAAEEVLDTDVYLGQLRPWQWRGVLQHKVEFALCVAAQGGLDQVNSFLRGLELGQLDVDGPEDEQTPLPLQTPEELRAMVTNDPDISPAYLAWVQNKRASDRPSGLTRAHIEAMKG